MTTNTNPLGKDVLYQVMYGSKLYGTSTPTSDTDLKSVFLPAIDDLLLGKRLATLKTRVDAEGKKVPDADSMPDNGVENEYIPFHTFVRDFVGGQTYAVELAYAILKAGPSTITATAWTEYDLVAQLVEHFSNNEVYSMVGFAKKQTFDYVNRGERLQFAQRVLAAVNVSQSVLGATGLPVRLDTPISFNTLVNGKLKLVSQQVLDSIAQSTGLKIGSTMNNNKAMRTLELNGRSYLESTRLDHLQVQLNKLINSYGDRTNAAAQTDVDYKSISHAVRVYQQAIELLDTGKVTFPRPNAAFLLEIKQGKVSLDDVKKLLLDLDDEVKVKMETSTVRRRTPQLEAEAEEWLLSALRTLYALQ